MFNSTEILLNAFRRRLRRTYQCVHGSRRPEHEDLLCWVSSLTLEHIANSDALYHNAEHTILVTLVGQEILRGKHMREGGVAPEDWVGFVVSLLCHDIGFVRGACRTDRRDLNSYATGCGDQMVALPVGSSDAVLNPYHVDRGKQFVREHFSRHELIDAEAVSRNIELTRFPVPTGDDHQDTNGYPGLVRAADLIGQLSDPHYLRKSVALFYEFEEIGTNKILGYKNPEDLRRSYPRFYWRAVHPFIKDALRYLALTQAGKRFIANLYSHVFVVEHGMIDEGQFCQEDLAK